LLHGERDRIVPSSHSVWLAERLAAAELRLGPGDGHISILGSAEPALRWLRDCAEN
jgi:pimeloyl-ACP methyl ester carboxylesterase